MKRNEPSSASAPEVISQVLDAENVKVLQIARTIPFSKQDISYLYWSTDNKRLLVFSCNPDVQNQSGENCLIVGLSALTVIDHISGQEIRQVPVDNYLIPKFFSGDGRFISVIESGTSDNWNGYFLDVDSGEQVRFFNTRVFGIDNSGETIVVDRGDGLSTSPLRLSGSSFTFNKMHPDLTYMDQGAFSRDSSVYAQPGYTSNLTYFIDFWNSSGGLLSRTQSFTSIPFTISFTADGSYLAVYFNDLGKARVEFWDSLTGASHQVVEWTWPNTFKNPFISISPDGKLLAFPNVIISQNEPNSVIEIINTETKDIAAIIPVPKTDQEIPTAFSGDGRWLAYATRSKDNNESWQINILAAKP